MTREEYLNARKLIRQNGGYARCWLSHEQYTIMRRLAYMNECRDLLEDRESMRVWNSGREDKRTRIMLTTWITREQTDARGLFQG